MRDIKFRAWDIVDKKYYFAIEKTNYFEEIFFTPRRYIVEQYTGIKDVNGVEIYEGDIIQPVRVYIDFPEIKPTNLGSQIYVESGNYVYGKWIAREVQKHGFGVDGYYFEDEIKLIGNIHDNADLLEETI